MKLNFKINKNKNAMTCLKSLKSSGYVPSVEVKVEAFLIQAGISVLFPIFPFPALGADRYFTSSLCLLPSLQVPPLYYMFFREIKPRDVVSEKRNTKPLQRKPVTQCGGGKVNAQSFHTANLFVAAKQRT